MRFAEIGQQLRAYRMESGLRAEEIAARLGVSRAALYRYEKGEVIKLDTVKRLAELLKVSPLSLLGIGVEYYSRSTGYFERVRQIEESADQILQISDATCYLTTSDEFDVTLEASLAEAAHLPNIDRSAAQVTMEQVKSLLSARKRSYQQRKPGIIALISARAVNLFLQQGVLPNVPLSNPQRSRNRKVAAMEMERIAAQMETEPMGLQFGLLATAEPTSGFAILRGRDRATLAVNPFCADGMPLQQTGVAMITGADEAIASHQRVAESLWREALRGPAAAAEVRQMIAAVG